MEVGISTGVWAWAETNWALRMQIGMAFNKISLLFARLGLFAYGRGTFDSHLNNEFSFKTFVPWEYTTLEINLMCCKHNKYYYSV